MRAYMSSHADRDGLTIFCEPAEVLAAEEARRILADVERDQYPSTLYWPLWQEHFWLDEQPCRTRDEAIAVAESLAAFVGGA